MTTEEAAEWGTERLENEFLAAYTWYVRFRELVKVPIKLNDPPCVEDVVLGYPHTPTVFISILFARFGAKTPAQDAYDAILYRRAVRD